MAWLVAPGGSPSIEDDEFVGVAIGTSDRASRQRHVAIVYRKRAGEAVRVSHLQWDYRFVDQEWTDANRLLDFFWQTMHELSGDPVNRASLVGFLDRLRRSDPPVPYGFRWLGCKFDIDPTTGLVGFNPGEPGSGLTCATFVVCIFASIFLPFIDTDSWPATRDGDDDWRKSIASNLLRSARGPRIDHAKLVEANGFDVRIRPEDIAGAAVQRPWPVSFDRAHPVALQIIEELNAILAPAPAEARQENEEAGIALSQPDDGVTAEGEPPSSDDEG